MEHHTPAPGEFVRIKDYIPDIFVELKYATADNFTGHVIYNFTEPWLRYSSVQKLAKAQEILNEQGYSLIIWDAFRPHAAQHKLWEVYPVDGFVANPIKGCSPHTRGNTVDVALTDLEGNLLEMPCEFDDFSDRANRDYSDATPAAARHATIMEQAMAAAGFRPYFDEWWHFVDLDAYEPEYDFIPTDKETETMNHAEQAVAYFQIPDPHLYIREADEAFPRFHSLRNCRERGFSSPVLWQYPAHRLRAAQNALRLPGLYYARPFPVAPEKFRQDARQKSFCRAFCAIFLHSGRKRSQAGNRQKTPYRSLFHRRWAAPPTYEARRGKP